MRLEYTRHEIVYFSLMKGQAATEGLERASAHTLHRPLHKIVDWMGFVFGLSDESDRDEDFMASSSFPF